MKQNHSAFLVEYFAVESLLDNASSDEKQRLFDVLAKVYGVSRQDRVALAKACENVDVRSIRCMEDYIVFMRGLHYEERFGKPVAMSDEVRFAIECKGETFKGLQPLTDSCGAHPTESKLREALLRTENNINVGVAALGAFLYFEGVILKKDAKKGVELAQKCLAWNDVNGILLLLAYGDKARRMDYLSALVTVTERGGVAEDYADLVASYNKKGETIPVSQEAQFVADYLDYHAKERKVFDAMVSKVARARILAKADKRRMLRSVEKNEMSLFSDLAVEGCTREWEHVWDFVGEKRKKEAKQIDLGLRKQNGGTVLTPVIVCGDAFAVRQHVDAVKAAANGIPVVCLDARLAGKTTFAPMKSNEVVKTLVRNNTDKAIFIVNGVDEIGNDCAEQIAALIGAENKANYSLTDANVTLDLSGCAFVLCAATRSLPDALRAHCMFVTVAEAEATEKRAAVREIFNVQKAAYECYGLTLGEDAETFLAGRAVDFVYTALEGVCHEHSYDEERYEITVNDLERAGDDVYDSQMAFVIKK